MWDLQQLRHMQNFLVKVVYNNVDNYYYQYSWGIKKFDAHYLYGVTLASNFVRTLMERIKIQMSVY